jgi:hypothetical protein
MKMLTDLIGDVVSKMFGAHETNDLAMEKEKCASNREVWQDCPGYQLLLSITVSLWNIVQHLIGQSRRSAP